jgi:starch-binding outer membrane protein, SusD/RagB family
MKTSLLYNRIATFVIVGVLGVAMPSCTNYVQGVQPRQDVIQDQLLNSPSQIPFLVAGMQQRMTNFYSQLTTLAGTLSDEFQYDNRVPGATFPQFQEINDGQIPLDNNSSNNLWNALGTLRFTTDNFIDRVNALDFGADTALRRPALYQGYLYSGLARYFMAEYYGLEPRRGGGVISRGEVPGRFIPSAAMIDSALAMYNLALSNATTVLQTRTINTLIAKANLAEGRYAAAGAAAQNGLQRGDATLSALYSAATVSNQWFFDGGRGRTQVIPDLRFAAYVRADSLEGRLVPGRNAGNNFFANGFDNTPDDAAQAALNTQRRLNLLGPFTTGGIQYFVQMRYPNQGSSVPITSWQENSLIIAETAIRTGNESSALTAVNAVRAAINLPAQSTITLESVITERDKQLFGTGTRLTDQRRLSLENVAIPRPTGQTYILPAFQNSAWHLAAETWWYLPIGLPERSANPNLQTP